MKSIKQQFIELKNSTPKHIQWILLGAAFVVVIILLVLLLGNKSNTTSENKANENISFDVEPETIQLNEVEVGKSLSKSINITVSAPVVIKSIDVDVDEITTTDDCDNLTDFCIINVIYRPTQIQNETNTVLKINWYIESQPDIVKTKDVSVSYSAWKKEEKKPEPKPEPVFVDEPETQEPVIEPEPVVEKAVEEIKTIAIENPLKSEEKFSLPPEKCSEFAIPGYDQSGRQIGWIKPERGANYFHPFSDKDCSNPTGRYDINTGIITSLEDGSKIGTDSDHIGYRNVRTRDLSVPQLGAPKSYVTPSTNGTFGESANWEAGGNGTSGKLIGSWEDFEKGTEYEKDTLMGTGVGESVTSSRRYDRTFILRQFKPIPATIVSEVRADPSVYGCDKSGQHCKIEDNYSVPVRATVDRNVYSDDGRTIILPTGTLLMGYLDGKLPGPYQAFGRMNIRWYQFIRPDGVEFNFLKTGQDPYSADAQGRMGVPGHGSTDYVEQMVMPILTALVPAAVNMIAPITDTVINQIDLDNNTVVQSGTIRSSEMAKQDIINTWNKITQKLLVDAIDNTVPPFSIAAGTRINVFSPVDLIVSCEDAKGSKCAVIPYGSDERRKWSDLKRTDMFVGTDDPSWQGQIRSFNLNKYCAPDNNGKITIDKNTNWADSGYDYRTVLAYCESQNYQAKNNAKQNAYNANIQAQSVENQKTYGSMTWDKEDGLIYTGDADQTKSYNTEILGLTYDDEGNIQNPWGNNEQSMEADAGLTCEDGSAPDTNGCCAGETYTDMGEAGFNCCPDAGGDCFPPIIVE